MVLFKQVVCSLFNQFIKYSKSSLWNFSEAYYFTFRCNRFCNVAIYVFDKIVLTLFVSDNPVKMLLFNYFDDYDISALVKSLPALLSFHYLFSSWVTVSIIQVYVVLFSVVFCYLLHFSIYFIHAFALLFKKKNKSKKHFSS